MSWRQQGSTGSNNIPLGNRRRFPGDGGAAQDESYTPTQSSNNHQDSGIKRGRSPTAKTEEPAGDGSRRRKKRNRWGDATENKAAGLMGLPTAIMANMTSEQLEAYTLHFRIDEITQKLRIDDVVPADGDRSPSPAPQYDNFGRRVNTREYRYRKRLEDERHKLIDKAMKVIPNYHPPQDYRRPTKTQEKVYVPVNDYPEINFIGLLIGPRGNTLKKMETESQAKIAIRGKGSVKEGKGRSDAAHTSNQEEDLHCLIMADTEEKAASIPEGQNELKRNQLRELAALNGTLRDDENQACQNCGEIGHRKYDCPQQRNFTANIICRVCGNAGHMARDCPDRPRGANWRNDGPPGPNAVPGQGRIGSGDAVDREYEQLMQELSGGAPTSEDAPRRIESGPSGYDQGASKGNDTRDARDTRDSAPSGPAPWARRGGEDRDRDRGGYQNGYNAPPSAAPWAKQAQPPAAPTGPSGYPAQNGGYGAYAPGYGSYPTAQPPMGAPPGLNMPAPPGLSSASINALLQQYANSPTTTASSKQSATTTSRQCSSSTPPSDQPPPPPPPGNYLVAGVQQHKTYHSQIERKLT
ncbi:hypothetical protein EYC84_007668 [Monilinia fructicola]|uniref:Branchpoint-bridging protein n=1 Tax=Monilinia fructicola TaxID=38448 RepID=A0A5M9JJ32_MONFR|nr:hypothetical protein EYC84_007668 [Monilinia fructicola]